MQRREITADVVAAAERLLKKGVHEEEIAAELGITTYVVRHIGRNAGARLAPMKPRKTPRRVRNVQRGIDAAAIRRVERMLEGGWLGHGEIARQAAVSGNLVADVAAGRRTAVALCQPTLSAWEQFLPTPIRCSGCAGSISIVPCRACRTRALAALDRLISESAGDRLGPRFHAWNLFDVIWENANFNHGGKIMQDLFPLLATELSAFLAAKDRREHLITRCEKLFDELVEPVNVPGPDQIIDPLLRAVIRPLVGRLFDEITKKLEIQAHAA